MSNLRRQELQGFAEFPALIGIFNELLVAEPKDQISILFDYGVLNNRPHGTTQEITGDGVVTDVDGVANISSTTGTAIMTTRDTLTYDAGHTNIARFTVSATGAGTGFAGLFDADDGFFMEFSGDTITHVGYRREGVDTKIPAANFNGSDISSVDWTKIQICYIIFGFLGVGNPTFFVLDDMGQPVKIHTIETINKLTTSHVRHPTLPVRFETSGAMEIRTASCHASIFGRGEVIGKQNFSADLTVDVAGGATEVLGNFRSKEVFEYRAGETTNNKKKGRLLQLQFFVDAPTAGDGTMKFTIAQASSVSGASFADVSQFNSVFELDTVGTPTVITPVAITRHVGFAAGGFFGSDVGGDISFDTDRLGLVAYAGDIFSIRAENLNGGTVTARVTVNWEEI